MIREFSLKTDKRVQFINIDTQVQDFVTQSEITEGVCTVFVPHTTAAVTINENSDPDVVRDMTMEINKIVPFEDNYRHMEGNSAAHLKSSFFGVSETVLIKNGLLLFGTWQSLYFCEFDGPRNRKYLVHLTGT